MENVKRKIVEENDQNDPVPFIYFRNLFHQLLVLFLNLTFNVFSG